MNEPALVIWTDEMPTYCGLFRLVAAARDTGDFGKGMAWVVCEQLHTDATGAQSWRPADTERVDHAMRAALWSLFCEVHRNRAAAPSVSTGAVVYTSKGCNCKVTLETGHHCGCKPARFARSLFEPQPAPLACDDLVDELRNAAGELASSKAFGIGEDEASTRLTRALDRVAELVQAYKGAQ